MAKFVMEMPDDIIEQFNSISENSEEIFGEMTKAGAEVVFNNVKANIPEGIRNSKMMANLKMTKTYKTPSDDGINTKVGFYGYFENENGEVIPAPLVANVFEYGRSNAPFPKQPFFRSAFDSGQIEKAMKEAQERMSGGLLKDE